MRKRENKMRVKNDIKLVIRRAYLLLIDLLFVCMASFLALVLRFDFDVRAIDSIYITSLKETLPWLLLGTLVLFWLFRMYHSLWEYAGIKELINVGLASVSSACFHLFVITMTEEKMPRSYYFLYCILLAGFAGGARVFYRFMRRNRYHINQLFSGKNEKRVMIVGAGAAGLSLIKEIQGSEHLNYRVCCVVDADKNKHGRYISGVPVVGDRHDIVRCAKKYKIDKIFIALPRLSAKELKPILEICQQTECDIQKIPGIFQLMNGEVRVNKLRKIGIEDLLGREPITVELESIMGYVKDQVILVTGGGGSIGSEICRQIASHNPKRLIILDIYENNAYDLQQELLRRYPNLPLTTLIASVRDEKRLRSIFAKYKPDIVYHAAAHKHVPLMEKSPNEAIKNNVLGTYNVVKVADEFKVKRFIQISTDKAVNPTNIMGASKRICEMIVQTYNQHSETEYVAVRFGNVLGSNGSVVPLFKQQIAEGGPITVTDPNIIRYFMTIPEAVSLVLQAGAYAKGGEIFVLDMGEPVRILDLAKNMIRLSGLREGEDIDIVFTGLRPGEKLYEELLMEEEGMQTTPNQKIFIGKPIDVDEEKLNEKIEHMRREVEKESTDLRAVVKEIVPTYKFTE